MRRSATFNAKMRERGGERAERGEGRERERDWGESRFIFPPEC